MTTQMPPAAGVPRAPAQIALAQMALARLRPARMALAETVYARTAHARMALAETALARSAHARTPAARQPQGPTLTVPRLRGRAGGVSLRSRCPESSASA
ncbi:MAG: hypothetical protein KDA27_24855 [Candidatus Eisenbacteria bacterium]|uniref:Uncharacterized protein n=1 Tax=Eiseniibacteriota bacterium TaxID=2212470 RepID=A0A956NI76_UNCEI|nr:hypothetical protein [Candidatus Eisenbacteria bacterium]